MVTNDFVFQLPDSSSAVGQQRHEGRWAAARAMIRITALAHGSLVLRTRAVTEHDGYVLADVTATARRGKRRLDLPLQMTFRFRDDQICALEESTPDVALWHQFWD